MADIAERLRVQSELGILNCPAEHQFATYGEAAAEIERLTGERNSLLVLLSTKDREIERLQAALDECECRNQTKRESRDSWIKTCIEKDAEIERLRARFIDLAGRLKGQILVNSILRQRPDLPVDRIPAAKEVEKLRTALEEIAQWHDGEIGPHLDEPGSARIARAALESIT